MERLLEWVEIFIIYRVRPRPRPRPRFSLLGAFSTRRKEWLTVSWSEPSWPSSRKESKPESCAVRRRRPSREKSATAPSLAYSAG